MAPPATSSPNHLKIITIAAAFLQIIVFVFLITCNIVFPYSVSKSVDTEHIISILSVCVLIVLYVINIVSAGYFIYKAFLNDPKCVTYHIVLLTNIVILLLHFEFDYAVLAVLEFYILCCTVALQRRYEKLMSNHPETPPPTYNSCNNDTQIPLAGPSSESNAQLNSEASAEIFSDLQVDPPKTTSESASSSGSVK